MDYIIKAEDITKIFENHKALDSVNLKIPRGSIFGLLGPNGAGKTTFLRIINQIIAPDTGEIYFDGQILMPEHIRRIGYLPEERGLYRKMKVWEQCLYLGKLKGLNKKKIINKLKYWFEKFELQAWWNKKVEELSKGMQQKIQFIITILHEPELLVFDEPFSGFDPINVNIIKNEILNLKQKGVTIIFSTHNMTSVEELCDYIVLINKAQNILDGHVEHIKEKYKSNTYIIEFKGNFNLLMTTLSADYKILEHTQKNNRTVLKIKLLNEKLSTNQLISHFLNYGSIISFNEVLPDMNEIFIKVVEEKNKQDETNINNN